MLWVWKVSRNLLAQKLHVKWWWNWPLVTNLRVDISLLPLRTKRKLRYRHFLSELERLSNGEVKGKCVLTLSVMFHPNSVCERVWVSACVCMCVLGWTFIYWHTLFSAVRVYVDVSPEVKAVSFSLFLSLSLTHTHIRTHTHTYTHTRIRSLILSFASDKVIASSIFPGSFINIKRFLIATSD